MEARRAEAPKGPEAQKGPEAPRPKGRFSALLAGEARPTARPVVQPVRCKAKPLVAELPRAKVMALVTARLETAEEVRGFGCEGEVASKYAAHMI